VSATDVFVGRAQELASLRDALERAIGGQGSLVLVSGEAGIGKTSLVREMLLESQEKRVLILTGRCYDLSATLPYGPWLEIADRYPDSPELPNVPEVLRRDTAVGDIASQTALFDVVCTFLTSVAATRPLVIVLEDLHWSDHASLDLLRYVARNIASHRILLIATYRGDEVTRENPLYLMLPLLVRESRAERISLLPLDSNTIDELLHVRYSLSATEQESLGKYLRDRAEGNPLFTVELLRTLELENILRRSSGGWTAESLTSTTVPSLIQQTVAARLSSLSGYSKAAIRGAAVIGQFVPFSQWEMITDPAHMHRAIEDGLSSHLLVETEDVDRLAFRHALVHEAVYLSIPLIQRRALHRKLADLLIQQGHIDPDEIAYHLQKAGDARAADWLIKAGERAQRAYAWLTAAEQFNAALELLGPERSHERGWLLLHLGFILRHSDLPKGIDCIRQSCGIARHTGDGLLDAVATTYLGLLESYSGNMRSGIERMKAGVDAIDELPWDIPGPAYPWVTGLPDGVIESSRSWFQVFPLRGTVADFLVAVGQYREAKAIAEWTIARRECMQPLEATRNTHPTRPDVYMALADSTIMLGDLERGQQLFDVAIDGYRFAGDHIQVLVSTMYWFMRIGMPFRIEDRAELNRRITVMEDCLERARAAMTFDVSPNIARIPIYFVDGRWKELRSEYETGLGPFSTFWYITLDGWISHYQGNDQAAWNVVDRVLPEGLNTEPGNQEFQNGADALRLAGTIALDSGDLDVARHWLQVHDRWLDWSGGILGQPESLLLWGRQFMADGSIDQAEDALNKALEIARDPRQPYTLISIHRAIGELTTKKGDFNVAASHLVKSLAFAERCNALFERACTQVALAEAQLAAGTTEGVRARLDEARQIGLRLDAQPLVRRANELANATHPVQQNVPYNLTPRELDVLRHVVHGMSDREIADHLSISHHTVMRHVSHILGKLGVDSRTAAATIAVREALC
jgi:DNA-binding CsgD family transcriptional regulator